MKNERIEPLPGQESVWDYPRPPRLEPSARLIRVVHAGQVIALSRRAIRLLETSHPPVYYIPFDDIEAKYIETSARGSFCEWKGQARYHTVRVGAQSAADAAWSYPEPTARYAAIRGHLAFYAGRVDECSVDGEIVRPQPGNFYGGWITADIVGPFKGEPGTMGW